MHILITGVAGFIGSHVAEQLLARGHDVRALDSLAPQVHPSPDQAPEDPVPVAARELEQRGLTV